MEVEQLIRVVGHARLGLIAARRRVPPEVLEPVFIRMVDEGYLTRQQDFLDHTEAGRAEAEVLDRAWADWLNAQLEADAGRPRSAELRAAADSIAKRLLTEDLANGIPAGRSGAPVGGAA